MRLPLDHWEAKNEEVEEVAAKFVFAKCYNQKVAGYILQRNTKKNAKLTKSAVPGIGNIETAKLHAK